MTNQQATHLIEKELNRAEQKHPYWGGVRHGHSVIEEEYEEFKNAVFADKIEDACAEAVQLGAMCARFVKNHSKENPVYNPDERKSWIDKVAQEYTDKYCRDSSPEYKQLEEARITGLIYKHAPHPSQMTKRESILLGQLEDERKRKSVDINQTDKVQPTEIRADYSIFE